MLGSLSDSGAPVVKSISQNHLCEGRSSTYPDLPTHGGGTPIRALLYSLVLTLCTRRLGWLELFVTALGDVDLAESLGLRVRFRCGNLHTTNWGSAILVLSRERSLFGDAAISVLNHTDLDLYSRSGSLLCGSLHSANSSPASILPWDQSDLVLGSADLAGSAQFGQIDFLFRQNETCRSVR